MAAGRRALPVQAPRFGLLAIILAAALLPNEAREALTLRGRGRFLHSGHQLSAREEPPVAAVDPAASPAITPEQAAELRAQVDAAAASIRSNHSLPPVEEPAVVIAGTPAPAPAPVQAQAPAEASPQQLLLEGGGHYPGYHETSSTVDDLLIVVKANRAEEEQRCAALKQSQQAAILETNNRIRELAAEAAAAPERLAAAQTEIEFITMELQRGQGELSDHIKRCTADGLLFETQLKNVARHKAIMERMLQRANCSSGSDIPNCDTLRGHLMSLRAGVDAKKAELEGQLFESRTNCTADRARREDEILRLQSGLEEQEETIRLLTGAGDAVDRRAALNEEMREHHEEYGGTLQGCLQRVSSYDQEIASLEMLKADLDRLVPHTAMGLPPLQANGQPQASSPPPTAPAVDAVVPPQLAPAPPAEVASPQPTAR